MHTATRQRLHVMLTGLGTLACLFWERDATVNGVLRRPSDNGKLMVERTWRVMARVMRDVVGAGLC